MEINKRMIIESCQKNTMAWIMKAKGSSLLNKNDWTLRISDGGTLQKKRLFDSVYGCFQK